MSDVDPRDVARLRTQARLLELALRGLQSTLMTPVPPERADEVTLALRTATEFAERCQVALGVALQGTPNSV